MESLKILKKTKFSEVQVLALGFFIVIFIGGTILSLPISSASGEATNFLDSIFTATSATCVTGLVTVDTGTHWNLLGQTVIMILIEIGGLGFMSFATFISVLIGRRITLKSRLLMQEAMNTFNIQGLVKMLKKVMLFTFIIQFIGALILSTQLIPEFGVARGIYISIFSSISTFCNAGFDLFGNFNSYTAYYDNSIILLTVSALIAIGGLGFIVLLELYNYKSTKKLSLHAKVVLLITTILIVGGTIVMFILENTLGNMNIKDKIVNSIVASISPRTAGINSVPIDKMTTTSKFITVILMFIGGSPGSTAGGLKTSTFGIILCTAISVIKGKENADIFGRTIPRGLQLKAVTLLIIGMGLVTTVTMALTIAEPNEAFLDVLYEATSAFGTVGLTTGVTQRLSEPGKIIIIMLMYLGRVGPLTVVMALISRKKGTNYKYPEGKILIG